MSQPLTVALPPGLALWGDCEIRVTALSPTTGNEVAGVQVSNVTLEVEQTAGGALDFGPFLLVTGPQA